MHIARLSPTSTFDLAGGYTRAPPTPIAEAFDHVQSLDRRPDPVLLSGYLIDGGQAEQNSRKHGETPMPAMRTLERFIARVEQNAHAETIEEFYTTDASMQENQAAPGAGRDALVAHERAVLARAQSLTSECTRPVFVNGDNVVIRWLFRFVWRDGSTTQMEELAYRRWTGECIAEETFF